MNLKKCNLFFLGAWSTTSAKTGAEHSSQFVFYIAVKQVGRKCSKEAIVTAQARLPEKQMSEILAEEQGMFEQITPFLFSFVAYQASLVEPWYFGEMHQKCINAKGTAPKVYQDYHIIPRKRSLQVDLELSILASICMYK